MTEKDYICNPVSFSYENGKLLVIIIDYLVITRDEVIEWAIN